MTKENDHEATRSDEFAIEQATTNDFLAAIVTPNGHVVARETDENEIGEWYYHMNMNRRKTPTRRSKSQKKLSY